MDFYAMKQVQSAQAQAAGASLQIGHRIWGVVPSEWNRGGDARRPAVGPFALRILAPDYQCGMRTIFGLRLMRFRFVWKSKGEVVPGHYLWDEVGPRFYWLPKRRATA